MVFVERALELINTIDDYLKLLKHKKGSVYYKSLNRWLGGESRWVFPGWLIFVLVSAGGLVLLFLLVSLLLRSQIKVRTAQLSKRNEELQVEIIEHKRTEDALRESEERYRQLVENINDVIFATDEHGVLTYVSPTIESVTGHSPTELIGRPFSDFVYKEDLPRIMEAFKNVIAGHLEPSEYRLLTKSEKTCWIRNSSRPLIMDSRASGIQGVLTDITDRKEAEEKKERLESQLIQAQKMEAVGTLAGGVAHDFNNLIQVIQGYAQLLLLDKDEGDTGYQELQEILGAAQRGGELSRRMLTFTRKVESEREPVDLNLEVQEVRRLLERTITKMIDIELHLAEDLGIINADAGQLEQVIMNVALNAKDAMPEGGKLAIQTDNVTLGEDFCKGTLGLRPGEYALLSISDTGHGMDGKTLGRIFEPFFSTKGPGKGTGLGLAMVHGIVKGHDGYITCASTPGEGTTFSIFLPIIEQMREVPQLDDQEVSVAGGSETILLVDDEQPIRNLGERILKNHGYNVLLAANGESGLERYRKEHKAIDLIILDLQMPGMGGKKCLEELLKVDPKARILIASGSLSITVTKANSAGASGFIGKPYDLVKMLSEIRRVLDED